jgi:hypothetical protein
MPNVSFSAPNDYAAEQQAIEQRRKYAEALQAQGMQPMGDTQMAGGWAIRNSPFQGLAKMLQAYSGSKGVESANEKQKELYSKYLAGGQEAIQRSLDAMQDRPARPAKLDPQEVEQMADQGTFPPQDIPAQKGDPYRALSMAMAHPMAQQVVGPMATQRIGNQFDMDALSNALRTYGNPPSAPSVTPQVGAGTVLPPGTSAQPSAPSQSPIPSWMPPVQLLGAGKYGPELFKSLAAANKPSDLQQDLAAAGIPINSPEGRGRILDPGGRLAAQNATLVDFTVPGTDIKTRLPNGVANALTTQMAPDVETAQIATSVAQRLGMKVNIGVGTIGGVGIESPRPLGEAEKEGMKSGVETTMRLIPKELSESLELAQNAQKRHNTLQQIHGALQSGKAITGPGASALTWFQRVGESAFGPGNKKSVVETQQLVQGLADLSLSGASAMRGQGAITEGERALLLKAKSGVQNLLPSELNELLNIFDKQARWEVGLHNNKMDRAEKAKFQNLDYWGRVPELSPLGQPKVGTSLSPEALDFMKKNGIQVPGQ